ncbi:unnamed protein product [Rotaria magnacalcarata]|uniref:Two-component system response regulator CreB n=1 Tax=Rotaria magnacalcarata TaxID=392030 RepID=A0A819KUD3_9BILA|nr:unnamed protein product [Rotaria magnacalcarata]CAF3952878.1 unnamed protein product [Rotaria magnacalcarata]
MTKYILLVEDDPSIAEPLVFSLQREGWQVKWCNLAGQALTWLSENTCDFIILDVGLPDRDGFDLCRQIRQSHSTPLLFLTARNEEVERIIGLEIGADDYCTKPFSNREIISRIKAIWRRTDISQSGLQTTTASASDLQWGPWHFDVLKMLITYHGQPLQLTRYEMRMLETLLRAPERVWSRTQLMQQAWDHPDYSLERTVDSHIKTLRQKLKSVAPNEDPIKTHRSLGYSLSRG